MLILIFILRNQVLNISFVFIWVLSKFAFIKQNKQIVYSICTSNEWGGVGEVEGKAGYT